MENTNTLIVTSSPHIRSPRTTRSIMLDVCIALIPAGVAAVILFGWHALALIVASVIASVASEAICQRLMHKRVTIRDWSAIVTGLLVAYNVPASAPLPSGHSASMRRVASCNLPKSRSSIQA